mmetsp:Transcript_42736/g.134677  ORF Transcript_42736/g.134677 Transcript_42736/m.134677 type:complete len:187 (+) Transcript_42736:1124-1684(+)
MQSLDLMLSNAWITLGSVSADQKLGELCTALTMHSCLSENCKFSTMWIPHACRSDIVCNGSFGLTRRKAVCSCLKVKKFPKGASVIRAGEIGDSMYFINNGVVKVEKQDLLSHFMMSSQTGLSGGARDRSIVYRRFFRRDRSYRFRESHCRRVICWELAHEGGCKKCDGRDGDRGHGIVSTLALGF